MRTPHLLALSCFLLACPSEDASAPPPGDAATAGEQAPAGRCVYTNPFSQDLECKEYVGEGWTSATAKADCDAPVPGAEAGAHEDAAGCDRGEILGHCVVDAGDGFATTIVFPGTDPGACAGSELGCGFAQGEFIAAGACDESSDDEPVTTGAVFRPFRQVCVDPPDSLAPGQGPNGQICTWEAISAATEEGRRYGDHASCEPVLTQRPYWPAPASANTAADDPRLQDDAWMTEFAWVTSQVESGACVCCHSQEFAPEQGPSGWYVEAEPIWVDSLDDDGLAVLAGWVDSKAFGAFPAAENNGFDRSVTGLPTTDNDRMKAFLEGELSRRGFERQDFTDTPPFGGPLYDQLVYEPEACTDGEGMRADGAIVWAGGGARYIYVMEVGSDNPGVPPNLDLPQGSLWRLDVDVQASPVLSGLIYGSVPQGTRQAWPEGAPAPELVAGRDYTLYVLRDIYQPLARCIFTAVTAPGE